MNTKIKIGLVGTRFAGTFHTEVWKTIPEAEIAAIAEIADDVRNNFMEKQNIPRGFKDYNEMLKESDIDVIDVCVPNFLHSQIAAAAMNAGKHVICEKPFATNLADGEKVVEVQEKTGRMFFYAEDWIFAPALARAQAIIAEGGIGKPLYYKGKEAHHGSHSPYAKTIQSCGGGTIIHLAIHPIGYFYHLLGMPQSVIGRCSPGKTGNFVHKDFEGEDWGVGILTYKDGTQAFVEGNYITTGGMDDKVEVYGTDGVVKVDLTFGSPLSVFSKKGFGYALEKAEFTHGWTSPAVDEMYSLGYKGELKHFINCVKGRESQVKGTTAQAGFNILKIVDAIYRSNRENRTIQL
ncbi:MAG: Gfo/Idh/MocA family oxidoreductase [Spirochaetota bacterium]